MISWIEDRVIAVYITLSFWVIIYQNGINGEKTEQLIYEMLFHTYIVMVHYYALRFIDFEILPSIIITTILTCIINIISEKAFTNSSSIQ
jgi:hypothetical protein